MSLLVIDNGYDPDSLTCGALRSEVSSRGNSTKAVLRLLSVYGSGFPVRQHISFTGLFRSYFPMQGGRRIKKPVQKRDESVRGTTLIKHQEHSRSRHFTCSSLTEMTRFLLVGSAVQRAAPEGIPRFALQSCLQSGAASPCQAVSSVYWSPSSHFRLYQILVYKFNIYNTNRQDLFQKNEKRG